MLDVFDFARHGRTLEGCEPIVAYRRFVADLPQQQDSPVQWHLEGWADGQGQLFLQVTVTAQPWVVCQRCMQPMAWPVHSVSRFHLVRSEAELDLEDDLDDPDSPEALVGSTRFDVQSLVEDELILAVPYVPRHQECPSLPPVQEADESPVEKRPSPFAVLRQLKKD
ncbi:MAG: DUF177 domain-containing protein [Burkholderiaceae bacterium]|jgi:uncharacterized protein